MHRNHVLFCVANSFVDGERRVACFAQAHSDFAFFVADDERYREGKSAAAGDGARDAADGYHLLVVLALGAGRTAGRPAAARTPRPPPPAAAPPRPRGARAGAAATGATTSGVSSVETSEDGSETSGVAIIYFS